MKRFTIFFLTIICAIGTLAAQTSFELRAPGMVTSGERFRIEFVLVNSTAAKFNPPTFTGLDILAGPVTSYGKFISDINGKVKESTTVTFTYTVQAQDGNKATMSAASVITEDGKSFATKASQIEIVKGDKDNAKTSQQTMTGESILLKMEVNKTEVYRGEPIVATLKIYTQVGIAGFEQAKWPAFNGFWKHELDMGNPRPQRTSVGNKVYESQALSQWLLYPQKAGVLEIEQCELTAIAQLITHSTGMSLFDSFFGNSPSVEHVRKKVSSSSIKIKVKDLPQPIPTDFSGGVGKFTMTSDISTNEVTANSGGTITVRLTGVGGFALIDAPEVEFPNGFEKYDTKQSEQLANTVNGSSGTRTWELPFIARAEGDYNIPGIKMSYFDPSTGKYVELRSNDFKIKVLKDTNPGSNIGNIVSGVTKEDLKILNQDIRYIRTGKAELRKRDSQFLWSAAFFASFGAIIAGFIILLVVLKQQIRNRADIAKVKNKKANSVALKRLKKAKTFLISSNESGFYEEMLRALWGYMGDKLTISVSDLSKERLREEFARRNVAEKEGEEFLNLIADCEMAQYSPVTSTDMKKAYDDALDLIGRLELK